MSLIIVGIFLLAFIGLYVWFIHNSNRLLIDLVSEKSGGKLKLEVSNVTFNFFSNEVKIHKAKISSTNKDQSEITYRVGFQKISLTTNSLFQAFFKNSLEVRKLKLYDPVIEVFKSEKDSITASKNDLSLGMELGKLYHSVDDAIRALNTHSISLINATVILNNNNSAGNKRLVFSNIYFTLKKLNKHKSSTGKYLDENDILFNSSNQDITFTDGIHKLSFKKLVITHGKNIILDSCSIVALPGEISRNRYSIAFKRLALIGVDFDALYRSNIIKADSVYCEAPATYINLTSPLPDTSGAIKNIPDPEKIISEFAGNLDLGFVGIMDGDIHLNIKGKKAESNIHSGKVSFQIHNLRINSDSASPVSITSFDMLIKGYKLYNADSSCLYSFDSVRFANSKLSLNNFSVHTASGINKIRSSRNYFIPYFELLGVDWPELIFNQNLKAREALLYKPVIDYTKVAQVSKPVKSTFFNPRHTFDDFMEIALLKIVDGEINIDWNTDNSLRLLGFNLNLLGDNLTDYKHVNKDDIQSLFFKNGYLKIGGIVAQLRNVTFDENDEIHANELFVDNANGGIKAAIRGIYIKNIFPENRKNIVIDGLRWEQGNILINSIPHGKGKAKSTSVVIKNISARQTQFKFLNGNIEGDAFIDNVEVSSLLKSGTSPIIVKGLNLKGRSLNFLNSSIRMNADGFILGDERQDFSTMHFENNGYAGTLVMNTPSLQLAGDINSFFTNNFHFKNISLNLPVIDYKKINIPPPDHAPTTPPTVKIDHLAMHEPVINIDMQKDMAPKKFMMPYSKGSEIKADDIEIFPGEIKMASLKIKTKKIQITDAKNPISIDKEIDASLGKINVPLNGNGAEWSMMVNSLSLKNSNGFSFNIKDNKLLLKDISVAGIGLSASSIGNIRKLINANPSAWISTSSASYETKNCLWQTGNIKYKGEAQKLTVDSISYSPLLSRDSAIRSSPYQMDYIDFTIGNLVFSGINLDKAFNENHLHIQKADLNHPSINVYRDKLPPFQFGRKKLFTEQIKDIDMPLSIDNLAVHEGEVSYTEKTAKSRQEGNLRLSHLNGNILKVENTHFQPADSLSVSLAGSLLDKASFDIKIRESYSDPLYGFLIKLAIQPTGLAILNPLLAPLSNVKFVLGDIDKFEMNAVGNENIAHGDMKFYYHNLRIQLLKNGGTEKASFIKRAESDLVNFFFLKNKNTSGTGRIYFERQKDYSFFNYMNKIIFSGITSNISARKNRKFAKLYRKNNFSTSE
ncbi:MAG: hypothetical protein ABI594_09610 [Ginsengibacter sp.]